MARRLTPFVNGEIYHVFNRTIYKGAIFNSAGNCERAVETIKFYLPENATIRYSHFLLLNKEDRSNFLKQMLNSPRIVDLISYCIMPTHFHLLLRQNSEDGIEKFMRKFLISFTKYFNLKNNGEGPLFKSQFKSVKIEDESQLLHVNRYIHLNPFSSKIVKNISDLENYRWSSLPEYIGKSMESICEKSIILSNFKNAAEYRKFVFDQADYQKRLKEIRHLIVE